MTPTANIFREKFLGQSWVYNVVYDEKVYKDLKSLDKSIAKRILNQIETKLAADPVHLGKELTGEFKGYYRFRVGDYRVVYKISQTEVLILVLRISHRKDIYDRFVP